jgi:hypothetical protein
MQNLPVMLAPPPRRVPLSLSLLNIFNGFAQIGWLVFGFGMIFGWTFAGNADFSSVTFRGPHAQAAGRVTSVVPTGASENRRRVMAHRYEFSVAGSTLRGTSYTDGESKSAGDEVTIEYDADHPERSRIAGMRRAQFTAGVGFVMIFPFIGAVLVLFATRTGFRRNRLLRHGILAEGKLLGRERTNVVINGQPVWALTFEFTARDGRRHEAAARTTDPARLEDEAQEPLLYDPDRPESAYVLDEAPARPQFEPNGDLRDRPAGFLSVVLPGIVIAANLLVLAYKMGWL